jgi:hypothetical protein
MLISHLKQVAKRYAIFSSRRCGAYRLGLLNYLCTQDSTIKHIPD